MFDNLGNMANAFSQMNGMKKQMKEMQNRVAKIQVAGSAGAGIVTVTASGENRILDVKINKDLLDSDDTKMLEDLVISATNDALKKVKEALDHEMKNMAGGADIGQILKQFGG